MLSSSHHFTSHPLHHPPYPPHLPLRVFSRDVVLGGGEIVFVGRENVNIQKTNEIRYCLGGKFPPLKALKKTLLPLPSITLSGYVSASMAVSTQVALLVTSLMLRRLVIEAHYSCPTCQHHTRRSTVSQRKLAPNCTP